MKVLFAVPSAFAHINPIVPLAGALQGAGHEVRVATHPEMTEVIRDLGLSAVAVGERDFPKANARGSDELYYRLLEQLAPDIAEGAARGTGRLPSRLVIRAFDRYYNLEPPGARGGLMADDLVAFARGWRPDLIIWDSICFPAAIAARVTGAAHARLLWSIDDFAWTRERLVERLDDPASGVTTDLMAERMLPMLERFGLEFEEELLLGQWTIDHYPAIRLRLSTGVRYVHSRPVPFNGSAVLPDWLHARSDRPRVALSLGAGIRSFFPAGTSKVLAEEIFDISAGLGLELVATLNEAQLQSVRTIPDNVRVVDYLPLNVLLPTCDAIIHHGGSGTFNAAVPHKLPHLVWKENGPYYEDIARAVEQSGAGLVIDDEGFSADAVAKQLQRVLTDASIKEAAVGLYRDMMAVPSPADVVPVLERLTAEHRRIEERA
ncbi:nucleotide disphospho-sugar-binding domain-containing protein [Actinomadura terrae]|uniref:nucleotide disphospho-sugar-binding domain-containing protein n=1 Tax=Actinomadura terrae TaxID=604353 RepID=UPI001FA73734|nr:nucleotide disphospho-sugar-binding domain-containing protein [Actinomadura terrae]